MISKAFFLLVVIMINAPKFNLISIGSFDQGIRIDDVIVLIFIGLSMSQRKFYVNFPKKIFIYTIFIGFSAFLAVLLHTGNDILRVIYFFRVTEYLLFASAVYSLRIKFNIELLFKFTLIFQLVLMILQISSGNFRPSGTFAGPWELTTVIGLLALYTASLPNKSKYWRFMSLIAVNFFSQSRTGLIAAISGILASSRSLIKPTIFFIFLAFPIYFFVEPSSIDWIQSIFKRENIDLFYALAESASNAQQNDLFSDFKDSADGSLASRFSIWLNLILLWVQNDWLFLKLLFGIGLGSVSVVIDGFYIRLFFELGIIGVILYFQALKKSWKDKRLRPIVIYISVICLTLDPYSSSKIAYALGLIFAYNSLLKNEIEWSNSEN